MIKIENNVIKIVEEAIETITVTDAKTRQLNQVANLLEKDVPMAAANISLAEEVAIEGGEIVYNYSGGLTSRDLRDMADMIDATYGSETVEINGRLYHTK